MSTKKNTSHETTSASNEFVEVGTDRPIWKPEECGDTAVEGYLFDRVEMPGDRPWFTFAIKLTAPCTAMTRDNQKVELNAGDEVAIAETFKLGQELTRRIGKDNVYKVRIAAKEKVSIGHGKQMWTYSIGVGKLYSRKDAGTPPPMLLSAAALAHQVNGGASAESLPVN